jgi:hypothetical protein
MHCLLSEFKKSIQPAKYMLILPDYFFIIIASDMIFLKACGSYGEETNHSNLFVVSRVAYNKCRGNGCKFSADHCI